MAQLFEKASEQMNARDEEYNKRINFVCSSAKDYFNKMKDDFKNKVDLFVLIHHMMLFNWKEINSPKIIFQKLLEWLITY